MKRRALQAALFAVATLAQAQEPVPERDLEIPGPIADGSPSAPVPPPELPEFKTVTSQTRRVDVIEAPPLPGLPPVAGNVSVTVRKVEDPKLPSLPLPPATADDPAGQSAIEETAGRNLNVERVILSATIYDHSRTLLRIQPNGNDGEAVTAWSNIDFNHFSGFGCYRVTEADGTAKEYQLHMGIGDVDTVRTGESFARHGLEYEPPSIPQLPDLSNGGPAFNMVEGGEPNNQALDILAQLHELYAKEGLRMRDAYLARKAEQERQRAFLLANPPEPKDAVIHYWRGRRPTNAGGGQ